jgi:hypothetical protein
MEQSFLGKLIVTSSGRQEIPRILWEPKVHCRFHNSTPIVPTLSQIMYPWYPSVIYVLCSSIFFLGRLASYISGGNNVILMVWTFRISICTATSHFHQKNVLAWNSSSSLLIKAPDGNLSSVGIATDHGLDGPGIESRWGRDFPPVQTGPGAHSAFCTMGTGLSWG